MWIKLNLVQIDFTYNTSLNIYNIQIPLIEIIDFLPYILV